MYEIISSCLTRACAYVEPYLRLTCHAYIVIVLHKKGQGLYKNSSESVCAPFGCSWYHPISMKSIGALLIVFLLAALYVQGKRVIRAAEDAEKTGRYIVKLDKEISHEDFEMTIQDVLGFSEDMAVYTKFEGVVKFFVVKLSPEAADKVYGACSAPTK